MAKITLVGMYNFDNSLFDGLVLPEGINKEEFVAALLLRDGEFEVLYPDFTFLKGAIGIWSAKWRHTFEKWLIGQNADWNPIENYDRYEDIDDTKGRDLTHTMTEYQTNSETSSASGTASGTDTNNTSGTNEALKSAYDSDGYQPDAKTVAGANTSATSSSNTTSNGSSTNNMNGSSTDVDKETETNKHTAHIHGNIGVTTSAAMLGEFYEISKWNLYDHMADLFKTELLIPIY